MRALIVDDVPSVRHYISMCLSEINDLKIVEAADGIEALRLAHEQKFDLLIFDINIPLLNGLRAMAAIRQWDAYQQTPVIIISTDGMPQAREQVGEVGGHLMLKPFNAFAMLDLARQLLHQEAPPPQAGAERRTAPRLRCRIQVEFVEPHRNIEMETDNVSMTGAFLVTEEPVKEGEQGRIVLGFPHLDEPLVLDCVVVHTRTFEGRPVGFGIRFDMRDPKMQDQMTRAFMSESR